MAVAGVAVVVFRKLNQPPILGYLIAGLLVGPFTFANSPVTNTESVRLLADLGLVLLLFGLDKKIQKKDTFFHNANSAFRREIWEAYPFNEKISNTEDRVWAKEVISKGLIIIYEPEASIYHWHGIHHNLNPQRASNVVRILESIDELSSKNNYQDPSSQNIVGIIPIRGQTPSVNNTCLLDYTIRSAKNSKFLMKEISNHQCIII